MVMLSEVVEFLINNDHRISDAISKTATFWMNIEESLNIQSIFSWMLTNQLDWLPKVNCLGMVWEFFPYVLFFARIILWLFGPPPYSLWLKNFLMSWIFCFMIEYIVAHGWIPMNYDLIKSDSLALSIIELTAVSLIETLEFLEGTHKMETNTDKKVLSIEEKCGNVLVKLETCEGDIKKILNLQQAIVHHNQAIAHNNQAIAAMALAPPMFHPPCHPSTGLPQPFSASVFTMPDDSRDKRMRQHKSWHVESSHGNNSFPYPNEVSQAHQMIANQQNSQQGFRNPVSNTPLGNDLIVISRKRSFSKSESESSSASQTTAAADIKRARN